MDSWTGQCFELMAVDYHFAYFVGDIECPGESSYQQETLCVCCLTGSPLSFNSSSDGWTVYVDWW